MNLVAILLSMETQAVIPELQDLQALRSIKLSKWTYKTAVAIANESTDTNTFEIICIVETNKMMLKDDKKEE